MRVRETQEIVPSDPYIKRIRPGVSYCSLCKKEVENKSKGWNAHRKSLRHQRLAREQQK